MAALLVLSPETTRTKQMLTVVKAVIPVHLIQLIMEAIRIKVIVDQIPEKKAMAAIRRNLNLKNLQRMKLLQRTKQMKVMPVKLRRILLSTKKAPLKVLLQSLRLQRTLRLTLMEMVALEMAA